MRLILLGAPGSGKGTISADLVESYKIVQISTGDILRNAVASGTELGLKASDYMKRGDLVPDDVIIGIIKDRLKEQDCANGFILDGFPRTLAQAEALKKMLADMAITLDSVIELQVPEEMIVDRIANRRTCSNTSCQAVYNVKSKPSKIEGICDICGGKLIQREDETREKVERRLKDYRDKTSPLIEYYKNEGLHSAVENLDIAKAIAGVKKVLNG